MNAEQIAMALAGKRCHGGWVCRCPAHEDRNPSLSLGDGVDGRLLLHCFAGCTFTDVLTELRRRGLIEERPGGSDLPRVPRPRPKPTDDEAGWRAAALAIWDEAVDPRETVVEKYLNNDRGIELGADLAGEVIRYHPRLFIPKNLRTRPEDAEPGPAMVCLMRDLRSDRPVGIHRTFLTVDGHKRIRQRAMLGRAAHAAIKLDPDDNVELGLVVGEGVETCLAARQMGFRPAWALGSAGAIGNLPVLGGIEGLTVLGENDIRGTNASETRKCARRWIAAGADVTVLEPLIGKDANDVLQAAAS